MLVSSIARFNAFNTMNNAAFAAMQAQNSMMNSANSFSGEQNLSFINKLEQKLQLDILSNTLLCKLASAQSKSLDFLA